MRRQVAVVAVLLALVGVVMASPQSGLVIDRTTGKPIEGAILVRRFEGSVPSPVDSHTRCFSAESAVSDRDGRYRFAWYRPHWGKAWIATAYKRGYHEVHVPQASDTVFMEPHSGDALLRFEQVLATKLPWDCPDADLREPAEAVLRGMREEALDAMTSNAEFDRADGLVSAIEWLHRGMQAAHSSAQERRIANARRKLASPAFTAVHLDASAFDPYVGAYVTQYTRKRIAFRREGDRFYVETPDGTATEILPSSSTGFFTADRAYWMSFVKPADSPVAEALWLASTTEKQYLVRTRLP